MTAALFSALAASCALTSADHVELRGDAIRVEDVADLSCLATAERPRVAPLIVAQVRPGETISMRRDALAGLVRRRVPLLTIEGDAQTISVSAPVRESPTARCAFAVRNLPAASVLAEADVTRAPCESARQESHTSYDRRSGLLRTTDDVESGDNLGSLAPLPTHVVQTSDPLSLTASVGVARIERRVEAMQDARSGERLFVRDADGRVFSIPLPDSRP